MSLSIGIDAGATLVKFAVQTDKGLLLSRSSYEDAKGMFYLLSTIPGARISVTGIFAKEIASHMGRRAKIKDEFNSLMGGVLYLSRAHRISLPKKFVITSIGSGTSVNVVSSKKIINVSGTAEGGGYISSICQELISEADLKKIISLADAGDFRKVHSTHKEISSMFNKTPLADECITYFSKLRRARKQDIASAVVRQVSDAVRNLSELAADAFGCSTIVYVGTTILGSKSFKKFLSRTKNRTVFLKNSEYAGAIGALGHL